MRGILLGFGIAIPLGSGAAFAKGREGSDCVGLTPRQYSVSDKDICSGETYHRNEAFEPTDL